MNDKYLCFALLRYREKVRISILFLKIGDQKWLCRKAMLANEVHGIIWWTSLFFAKTNNLTISRPPPSRTRNDVTDIHCTGSAIKFRVNVCHLFLVELFVWINKSFFRSGCWAVWKISIWKQVLCLNGAMTVQTEALRVYHRDPSWMFISSSSHEHRNISLRCFTMYIAICQNKNMQNKYIVEKDFNFKISSFLFMNEIIFKNRLICSWLFIILNIFCTDSKLNAAPFLAE